MGLCCCTARGTPTKVQGWLQDGVQDNMSWHDETKQDENQGNLYNAGDEKNITFSTDHPNCSWHHDKMQDDEQDNYNVGKFAGDEKDHVNDDEQGNCNSNDEKDITDDPNFSWHHTVIPDHEQVDYDADDEKDSRHDDKDSDSDKGKLAIL